jgi:2'-5' RNA ligase
MERAQPGNQIAFDGFSAQPSERLFFGIYPDAQTAQRIFELARTIQARRGLRAKSIAVNRMHITLHHLGDHAQLPEPLIAAASEAATQVLAPPFEVDFDRVASFSGRPRNRPCVLRNEEGANAPLLALQRMLGERLIAAGMQRRVERRFTPHVTLFYCGADVPLEMVEPVRWTVHQFALVHSLLGRGQHRILRVWRLA